MTAAQEPICLSYNGSSAAVNANLATNTFSGGDAEGDVVANIENLLGSDFNDILVGNDAANVLYGVVGDDTLFGNGGADIIYGWDGQDTLSGGGRRRCDQRRRR
ncbi:MAG: hypothetical protein WDN06_06290 [Asticcacaulis sp.]